MKADPYMLQQRPGALLEASRNPKKRKAVMKEVRRKAATGKVSHTGTFEGKSNKLGQGGRAAQLKARGVPGGVIGNLARAAHAAPGQANYHKKTEKKRKSAMTVPQEMAMKRAPKHKSAEAVHHHIHIHGKNAGVVHVHMKGTKVSGTGFGDETLQDDKLEHSEVKAHGFKKAGKKHKGAEMKHKCKGAECKHASHKKSAGKK